MWTHPTWKTYKYGVLGGLGGLLALLSLLGGTAWYIVETLTRPNKRSRFAHHTVSPWELRLPVENVVFPTRTGDHQVSGWFVPSPQATSTIIICPGFRASKTEVLGVGDALWQAGHHILVFEYYGHGAEVGTAVTLGYRELDDFLGAVAYVQARVPHTRIGVLGYSMGAAIAIMGSARTPAIAAVVADSAFATHASAVGYNIRRVLRIPVTPLLWLTDHLLGWRAGYRFHQVEPVREIAQLAPRPLLLIHGGEDTLVDLKDATRLYQAAQGTKALWVVPEAEHCGAYFAHREAYVTCVREFFARHLQKETPDWLAISTPSTMTTNHAVERMTDSCFTEESENNR